MRNKSLRNKVFAILFIVVFVLLLAGAYIGFSVGFGKNVSLEIEDVAEYPVNQLKNSWRLTLDVSRFPITKCHSVWEAAEDNGETRIVVGDRSSHRIADINKGKLYYEVKDKSNPLSEKYTVYTYEDEIAFQMPDVFGDDTYGFSILDLSEEEKDSFWYTSLGIDFDEIISEKSFSVTVEDNYIEKVLSAGQVAVNEYLTDINGEEMPAINIEVILNGDQIREIYQYIETLYGKNLNTGMQIVNNLSNHYDLRTLGAVEAAFNEVVEVLSNQDIFCQIKAAIDPATGVLMKLESLLYGKELRTIQLDMVFGRNPASDPYTFIYSSQGAAKDDVRTIETNFTYSVDTVSKTENHKIKMNMGGAYSIATDTIHITKGTGEETFSAVITNGQSEHEVNGNGSISDVMFEFSIGEFTIAASVQQEAEVPNIPEYNSIIDLTAFDLVRMLTGHEEIESFEDFLNLNAAK